MDRQHNYYSGVAAEQTVAKNYEKRGFVIQGVRVRMPSGEIDLVVQNETQWVFIEVKKSQTIERAAARITNAQAKRIQNAATEYLSQNELYGVVDCRFDAAFVDGIGNVEVIENVFI